MFSVHGVAIGGGIVIGRAHVLEADQADVSRYRISVDQLESEVQRLDLALSTVRNELKLLSAHLPGTAPPEARALLEAGARGRIIDHAGFLPVAG